MFKKLLVHSVNILMGTMQLGGKTDTGLINGYSAAHSVHSY